MLLSKLSVNEGKKTIVPSVSPNVANIPNAFGIFFEAYNARKVDSVRFVAVVLNEKKERQLETDTVEALASGRNEIFMKIDNTRLPIGDYTLYVREFARDSSKDSVASELANTSRYFNLHWRGLPRSVKDLDLAISQLRYIATDAELSYIKEGATPEERQKRFIEYWKKKDPNPNTPRNEKMEQYYAKVEYANKHFSHYVEGWRTDMGMVFIIFGAPNSVDRHPFEVDSKPYEVWSYYDLNHQFVFVDESGFGDYRLTTPIWDVWNRQRD
jgi:GWxTD domain-containing protein